MALFERSSLRSIKDDHRGLSLEAAHDVLTIAYHILRKGCSNVHTWLLPLPDNDVLAREVETILVGSANVRRITGSVLEDQQIVYFTDPYLTQNHPLIETSRRIISVLDADELNDFRERHATIRTLPLKQVNEVLDVISLYRKPDDRSKYIPLERLLTAMRRVIYVVFDRA